MQNIGYFTIKIKNDIISVDTKTNRIVGEYMEYFNTHKNKLFLIITRIMNQSLEGKKFEIEEVENLINNSMLAEENFLHDLLDYGENPYKIMSYDFKPLLTGEKLRINPTILEKRWLKSVLESNIINLFLDEKLVKKLKCKLDDVENLFCLDIPKSKVKPNVIAIIIEAFENNKVLIYDCINRRNEYFENQICLPFKINYSMFDNKFRLSVYSMIEERFIYMNLENIKDVSILDMETLDENNLNNKIINIYNKIKKVGRDEFFTYCLEKEKRVAKMQIFQDNNVMERIHLLFAAYDKKSYKIRSKQFINIYYYKFEEEHIIKKILNLGTSGKVEEPRYLKEKIIDILKKGEDLEKFSDGRIYAK